MRGPTRNKLNGELVALCQVITEKLHSPGTDPIHLYIHARDLAYFKLHFFSGDRPSDLSHVKAAEMTMYLGKLSGLAIPVYLPSRGIRTPPFAL